MRKKILRPFTGAGAVMFPIGKPPEGTCQFATKKCLRFCYVEEDADYDEEMVIPDADKKWIYEQFMTQPIEWMRDEIDRELDGLQTPILHWFGSGDCLTKDMKRISEIIDVAATIPGIVQMGFTRNVKLWKKYKNIFALTIENKNRANNREGMFSIPDYPKQVSVMYATKYRVRGGQCGSVSCSDLKGEIIEHAINCKTCLRLKAGCFDRRFRK